MMIRKNDDERNASQIDDERVYRSMIIKYE